MLSTDSAATAPLASAWRRVVLVWLVLATILIAVNAGSIVAMRFGDPDDALRLLQVRDLLGGQAWFDVHQYRIAAPAGVPMHWSRLVDMPIAGVILLLRPLLGAGMAELAALVIVPLLTLLCVLLLVGRLAAKYFDGEVVGIACLVTGIASPVLFQLTPMRIDHHGWQIVLALAALNGMAARDALRGGMVIGLSLAALMAISIEGLPLAALFLGICALRGLRSSDSRQKRAFDWLASATSALAFGSIAIFLATRGLTDLATHCDAVSPVHLAVFVWGALGAGALRLTGPRPLPAQIGLLALIGAGALAIMLTAAPQCRGGAFVDLDPLVRRYWYTAVTEGLPAWKSRADSAVTMVFVPLFGLYASFRLWREAAQVPSRIAARDYWLDHLLLLAGAWAIGVMVARASATACVIGAVPTAALVTRWIVGLRESTMTRRLLGYCGIALVLLPALPVVLWTKAHPAPVPANTAHVVSTPNLSHCRYAAAGRALDALPATDIFAPLDIGPDLLVHSHHRVVATGHHRGSAGMHDVIAAFLASPDEARRIVLARHTPLLAICPDIAEPAIYAHAAPHGLMAHLLSGKAPAWLQPVDLAPGTGLRFWRVVQSD